MEQKDSIRLNEFFVITKTARRTEVEILKDKEFISFSAYPGAGSFLSGVKAGDRHVWELDNGEWVKVDDLSRYYVEMKKPGWFRRFINTRWFDWVISRIIRLTWKI